MIYLVSKEQRLFESEYYEMMSVEKSMGIISKWNRIQLDTETNGRDCHINKLMCIQFGNKKANMQIIIDYSSINILVYKEILESKLLILQNGKFDLQFLYCNNIFPLNVYDTMIVEQLLYLGYPYVTVNPTEYHNNNYTFPYLEEYSKKDYRTYYTISYSLKAIAAKRLSIDIDKTVRGEIIWRGLDDRVIVYAAGDVMYLEDIMESQIIDLRNQGLLKAAQIENRFVPVIAFLEWCGIYLNESKWLSKMEKDKLKLEEAEKNLNSYVEAKAEGKTTFPFCTINLQGDLFSGFDDRPKCNINWSAPAQVTKFFQYLGFDTKVQDKKTGEDKDSVLEKHIKGQKGIADDFLKIYFDYKEHSKVCTTYGQGHLNAINPITGRIHTSYKQLGCASGRMSCGSRQNNDDLAIYKKISRKECSYPNIQQLPADDDTRGSFTNQFPNTLICSADFSALESRLGGDIYNESAIINEFNYGSGDMHSLVAKACFPKELEGIEVKDIKKLRPDLRKKAKGPEFAMQFDKFFI